ncbi:hypothetical protein DQ04_14441000 [Trypanosoma grayi]|uniref:hypothetical protein n=1 Tax=Trypanosoma grayi TaxID=71804 RepID=UPI0004F4A731|nr:hypothetical protein DQ04_14441000 [Trypanosoma grayi]KEG06356.1 hypothetical protein DQ04_14441000 [Trypanosoma grayi]
MRSVSLQISHGGLSGRCPWETAPPLSGMVPIWGAGWHRTPRRRGRDVAAHARAPFPKPPPTQAAPRVVEGNCVSIGGFDGPYGDPSLRHFRGVYLGTANPSGAREDSDAQSPKRRPQFPGRHRAYMCHAPRGWVIRRDVAHGVCILCPALPCPLGAAS